MAAPCTIVTIDYGLGPKRTQAQPQSLSDPPEEGKAEEPLLPKRPNLPDTGLPLLVPVRFFDQSSQPVASECLRGAAAVERLFAVEAVGGDLVDDFSVAGFLRSSKVMPESGGSAAKSSRTNSSSVTVSR